MASDFEPDLSILQAPQRRLWGELIDLPSSFVLCGGTAVALRLGHRQSIDFDFFNSKEFDPDRLYETTAFLDESKVIQKAASTLTCLVDRGGPVRVSFFGVPRLRRIQSACIVPSNGLRVASLLDLAGMKAAVVQRRAEAKDYIDFDAIISRSDIDLPRALAAGRLIYGSAFNPQNTLKALAYYGDGNLNTLSQAVRDRLAAAVKAVDLDCLPDLEDHRDQQRNDGDFER